jgi:hypothetical protein
LERNIGTSTGEVTGTKHVHSKQLAAVFETCTPALLHMAVRVIHEQQRDISSRLVYLYVINTLQPFDADLFKKRE